MHKLFRLVALLAIVTSLATGCANRATAIISPSSDLSTIKTMYVRHYPSDNSGVNMEIADKLRSKGVTVTTGSEQPPSNFDAIVTYKDKWMWDITMYMLELTIDIRDPKTETPLATGNSYHTSLTRKSQTEMIDEIISNIYGNTRVVTVQGTSKILAPQPTQSNKVSKAALSTSQSPSATEGSMQTSLSARLEELNNLKKTGVITEDEYASKRKQLIEKF
ncbi:MAG TPA: hypothetical protein VIK56_00735 [Rhodoferax sp.]